MFCTRLCLVAIISVSLGSGTQAKPQEVAHELIIAISLMLYNPAISGHGIALENYEDERYDHSITVIRAVKAIPSRSRFSRLPKWRFA